MTRDVVKALVFYAGRCLILTRSETVKFPGIKDLPGGKVEDQEDHESAITREVQEETALIIQRIQYIGMIAVLKKGNDTKNQLCTNSHATFSFLKICILYIHNRIVNKSNFYSLNSFTGTISL